jgi:hypothetical protein
VQEDKRFKNLPLILITFSSSGFHLPVSSRRKGKGGKRENIEKALSMMKRTPQLSQKWGCTLLLNNILTHTFNSFSTHWYKSVKKFKIPRHKYMSFYNLSASIEISYIKTLKSLHSALAGMWLPPVAILYR